MLYIIIHAIMCHIHATVYVCCHRICIYIYTCHIYHNILYMYLYVVIYMHICIHVVVYIMNTVVYIIHAIRHVIRIYTCPSIKYILEYL